MSTVAGAGDANGRRALVWERVSDAVAHVSYAGVSGCIAILVARWLSNDDRIYMGAGILAAAAVSVFLIRSTVMQTRSAPESIAKKDLVPKAFLKRLIFALAVVLFFWLALALLNEGNIGSGAVWSEMRTLSIALWVVSFGVLWAVGIPKITVLTDAVPSISVELAVIEVVTLLRNRARRLRNAAAWTMALVVVTLIAGTVIFFFAGAQARREADNSVLVSMARLTEQLDDAFLMEDRYVEVYEQKLQLWKRSGEENLPKDNTGSVLAADLNLWKEKLDRVRQQRKELEARLALERDRIAKSPLDAAGAADAMDNTIYFVSSLSTRTGVVLLLVFLVRILTQLYKYNMKLASFLSARADALQLSPNDHNTLKKYVDVLSTESIDYGAEGLRGEPTTVVSLAEKTFDGLAKVISANKTGVKE